MTRTLRRSTLAPRASALLGGGSLAALALAVSFAPAPVRAQDFGTMVGMQAGRITGPNGQVSVWTGANRPVIGSAEDGRPLMTIKQTQEKALLDWEDFRLKTNEVLEFQQQSANWIAVNRVHGNQAAEVNGEIRAIGKVYIFNDNGVLIGKDAKINTRTLVTGRGFSDVNVAGNTTTIVQSAERGALDWNNMSLQAGEVLKIQQEKSSWIALNRSYNKDVTRIDGTIEATGNVYLVAPSGLAVDGKINAQQVILSSLFMRDDQLFYSDTTLSGGLLSYGRDYNGRMDPTFSNSWYYPTGESGYNPLGKDSWAAGTNLYELMDGGPAASDPNDPLRYNVTIGRSGVVTTGKFGKVVLAGPNVTNKGIINVSDEGQVILAAGDNVYLQAGTAGMLQAYSGAYNGLAGTRSNIYYFWPTQTVTNEKWRAFYSMLLGRELAVGDVLSSADVSNLFQSRFIGSSYVEGGLAGQYLNQQQALRAREIGFTARNEGIINAKRGGTVDFRGLNLEQMGAVDITSTALFRGAVTFNAAVYDYRENINSDSPGWSYAVPGHGDVVFGKGSLTQITPDLESTDKIPVSGGAQSVGSIKINANSVHMQQDSIIYMPSGKMNVLLDAGQFMFDNHMGNGANQGNEDGTRFLMEAGATIDLSGWKATLAMGYHQVTGKLFAAQLSDSPIQKDGPLYRKEISIDRRFGTNLANWSGFDNLSQGTLAQFLTDGGSLTMDIGDDFIMKSGSVINVSGGVTTYQDGFVYTTLLRRLDGTIIDIREADPDELYMGLANEWVDYDTKWGKQTKYYIPLMSSVQGKYETSYQQGGKGGTIKILAPDTALQGTLRGETVAGRYQRGNIPAGGSFILNNAGESEGEYVSNNILIAAQENLLSAQFGFRDKLSDQYGELFGDEYDLEEDGYLPDTQRTMDNTTLTSADFFNRSTMGSYSLSQGGRVGDEMVNNAFLPLDGAAILVEAGVNLNLANGASFELSADQRIEFLGSIRTEGGDVALGGMALKLGATTKIDTRGSWYSDYEIDEPIALTSIPRIHGGDISLAAYGSAAQADDVGLVLPATAVLDSSGGAWVNRNGAMTGGKGGNLTLTAYSQDNKDALDIGALANARAYGLAGNGAFALNISKPLVIGHALPPVDPDAPETGLATMLILPSLFERSGFSAISLAAPSISLLDGASVTASTATLQFNDQSLHNGLPPAFWTPSGTDIYDVANIVYLTPEQRPAALRRGMDLNFIGLIDIGEGSLLSTGAGGKITLLGSAAIDGTVLAPAGAITIGEGSTTTGSFVTLGATAKLLAPGASLITWRGVDALGHEIVDGEIYDGGAITLAASTVTLEKGALLDVSGTSAIFDLSVDDGRGGILRQPTTLASDGGSITLDGLMLEIDEATYMAGGGGADARGGAFNLIWNGVYGGGTTGDPVATLVSRWRTARIYLKGGNTRTTTLFGIDLSKVDFARSGYTGVSFEPGFTITNEQQLRALVDPYEAAAKGTPPMLVIGEAIEFTSEGGSLPSLSTSLRSLFGRLSYTVPTPSATAAPVTVLDPAMLDRAGFSSLGIDAAPGVIFSGNVKLGGKRADGSYIFDTIAIAAPRIFGRADADVHLEAGVVQLTGGLTSGQDSGAYVLALANNGIDVRPTNRDSRIEIKAGTLLQVGNANFYGFADTSLVSAGDIRFAGESFTTFTAPSGTLYTPGKLTLKADQIYAGTARTFSVTSDTGIEILAQDDGGPINDSPYEAGARLTLRAPTIVQGGTLRSPLGTLNLEVYANGSEGSGTLILAPGSLTSVSAEGKVIPFGFTSNGDTWLDPYTGLELTTLPAKTINLVGDTVDIQSGAVLDVSGGGDLFAREFVPGVGGTVDWLTGYRDEGFNWVSAPDTIYAVLPDYAGNIAPLGFGASKTGIGDKVYLSGGSGLKAGYYTLLPAEYALLPGAFRVTANHRYGNFTDAPIGKVANLTDGSTVQSGYRVDGASGARDPRNIGFHVMPGSTLRMRSDYIETAANTFFASDAFLRKALRINRPVSEIPRTPLDGGSVVFKVAETLNLDGTLKSAAGKGGRGGFADIASSKILVAGADTDVTRYDGYLVLNSAELNAFGAESVLIGGVRAQGATNMELTVSGTDLVIDNAGSVLYGPELLFASTGNIDVLSGSKIESRGTISGSSGDLRILAYAPAFVPDNNTAGSLADDYQVHGELDKGAVLRVSSGQQIDILRNGEGVSALNALRADPQALAALNAIRATKGLAAIDANGGLLTIADGASIISSQSVALDATQDTLLAAGATLQTKQLSASASQISIGAVPVGTGGLVFAGGALGTLGNAADLTLKSYGTIDLYGGVALAATGGLRLDTREIRLVGAGGGEATISAGTLTLANSSGGTAQAMAGDATLRLDATNLYIEGDSKWLSGIAKLDVHASERVIGRDDTRLYVPGQLAITSGGLTTESSARLFLDATGAIDVRYNGNTKLPVFQSFGGTLGLIGASVNYAGQTRITGGSISLQSRTGDVVLAADSVLDVTSNVSRFYDKSVGVSAGSVNLVADLGDVVALQGSLIDVSGTDAGGNAGTLSIRTGLGEARLGGTLRGTAEVGYASGSFNLVTQSLADFAAFNSVIDAAGFRQSRRYEINSGDVTIAGTTNVQNFAVIANDGAVNVTGTIQTTGRSGGTIQISAAEGVTLASTARLLASAGAAGGAGGNVLLETTGQGDGAISTAAGSVIDVSGAGEGGRLVRFRAPQLGTDIAIGQLGGSIAGARSVIAEGYRVYDGVAVIDQGVIDRVEGDAAAFMAANAAAIRTRLGTNVTLTAGIELRSDGDMALATDWDLSGVRFDGAPGVLTLRAAGDLKIDADLSDGFVGTTLMSGDSWAFNLTAGANIASPDSMAVLSQGLLAEGAGSVIVGGTPDTIEYYYDPAFGNENRLYLVDEFGRFMRNPTANQQAGFIELDRDANGNYLDPRTGELVVKDPQTGDYIDTTYYARRPLPWLVLSAGGYSPYKADGSLGYISNDAQGNIDTDLRDYIQWNNATGYMVRTGTGAINIAAGRDLTLQERGSVIYTAGQKAADLAGFTIPAGAQYGQGGGDLKFAITGDILANALTPQMPSGYMGQSGAIDRVTGLFDPNGAGGFNQTSWWVNYAGFQGGIGALGGGNVDIQAGGDIDNLGVALPNSGRVTGNTVKLEGDVNEPMALTPTGGGNLALRAGGNLYGGAYYVASGAGDLNVGGAILAGSTVYATPKLSCDSGSCYLHEDFRLTAPKYDLYSMFFTSSGQFDIKSGGDLNIESIMDPLIGHAGYYQDYRVLSYTAAASARLFSAGGDVTLWNNGLNVSLADFASGPSRANPRPEPVTFFGTTSYPITGRDSIGWDLYPSTVSVVAATGDVRVLGGMTMLPSATGQLDLLAGGNVYIGYGTQAVDPFLANTTLSSESRNYRGAYQGVFMSQADVNLLRTPTNQPIAGGYAVNREQFRYAGGGSAYPSNTYFDIDHLPDLHVGDTQPVRIYAAGGDIITSNQAMLVLPKHAWLQAEGNIYFPSYYIQHNNPNDLSIVRAGEGIYFDTSYTSRGDAPAYTEYGHITLSGPGRLEVEAGTDIWLPSNALGITSQRIKIFTFPGSGNRWPTGPQDWHLDEKAADIAISTGFNKTPSYQAFEDAYLNPGKAAGMADYLLEDDTGLSLYLFDRDYQRAEGATGEFAVPEPREGLVNYVRRLQGLDPLKTKTEQRAYLDTAWSYWEGLPSDFKTPYYRSVLFLELRTTGREANDPDSERFDTSFRGYKAIETLFPGAQKDAKTALAEGESRWAGNFETYASRVISNGGGKIEFVVPGGAMTLANVAAKPAETGQPASEGDRGNALRAGIVTNDGGEINILTHGSVAVNQSRILTSKGGNVLIWSSWGDIAAGQGAKTSISPQFYNYTLDNWARMNREPAGLPTGAGIGTLATQPGTPPADVDLIAPAGIVDAGDAGIRVSGNFNVYAIEVLGTDNIDVAGVQTGLPIPPAAPPTSLDTGEVGAKSAAVDKALDEAVSQVRKNAAIVSPSLIEVRVTGYGNCGGDEDPCPGERDTSSQTSTQTMPQGRPAPTQVAMRGDVTAQVAFNIDAQPLDDAIRAVGRASGLNILYDAAKTKTRTAPALRGNMTPEEALRRLLSTEGLVPVRIGPRTIMLRRQTI